MSAVSAFFWFALERLRCAILALCAIVLVKIVAVMFFAPLLDNVAQSGPAHAALP